LSKLLTAQ
jgi:hypothetical protein